MKIYKYLAAVTLSVGLIQSAHSSPWPTGLADNLTVNAGQKISIPVLENDSGDNLKLVEVNTSTVALGEAQIDATAKAVYYTSAPGFTGEDSFWYAFEDSLGRSNAAKVTVKVISTAPEMPNIPEEPDTTTEPDGSANDNYEGWPAANVDKIKTPKNTAVTIAVLDNDIGDRLSLTEMDEWTVNGGRTSISGDSVLYSPKENLVGEDSFWYNFVDARGRTNSTQVKVTIVDESIVIDNGASAEVIANTTLIPMHVDLLKNQRSVWDEAGGTQSMSVTQAAAAGSSQLQVAGGFVVKDKQLITYLSTDGDYYTVATSQSQGNTINLRTALPAPIAKSAKVWNFYIDPAHPNTIGYRAIADFALRNNDVSALNTGKHVMLGDSWFDSVGMHERLSEKLRNADIINEGIGGNTTAMLLERFDNDVSARNPDIVWLMIGTNDYHRGVSVDDYIANMQKLIEKIQAIGAKAMVFDSSVAQLMSGSDVLTDKSHAYAKALADLLNR